MSIPHKIVEKLLFEKNYKFEIGKVAKQASGAVLATCEGTTVLATVVAAREKIEGEDFLPLTINYQEKSYAAGKILIGSREGRTAVFQAATEFKLLAENKLEGSIMASPAVYQDDLLIRTDSYLYRISTGGP